MTEMAPAPDRPEAIVFDYDLAESPEKLWRALTDPVLVAAWLAPTDMAPDADAVEVGQRFSFTPFTETRVEVEVLEAEPKRRLSYRWREAGENGPALDSVVTFEITPLPAGGAHLRLVHRGMETAGSGGMVGMLAGAANDNRSRSTWMFGGSFAWAA